VTKTSPSQTSPCSGSRTLQRTFLHEPGLTSLELSVVTHACTFQPLVKKIGLCTSCRFQKNGNGRTHGHCMSHIIKSTSTDRFRPFTYICWKRNPYLLSVTTLWAPPTPNIGSFNIDFPNFGTTERIVTGVLFWDCRPWNKSSTQFEVS
jgi:hypothetical protein